MKYRDIETGEILTAEYLRREWETLKADGETEADTFNGYLRNCLDATLEEIR